MSRLWLCVHIHIKDPGRRLTNQHKGHTLDCQYETVEN